MNRATLPMKQYVSGSLPGRIDPYGKSGNGPLLSALMGRDLRKYARQTNTRLIIGFIVLLLVIGIGLIFFFYGKSAAIMGLFCILAAFIPVLMVLLAFWIIDLILRANKMR